MRYVDHHNLMMNVTTRIAIEITELPPFEFRWDDLTPQRPTSSLSIDDILPSAEDGRLLYDRATKFVSQFLLQNFPALKGLAKMMSQLEASSEPACTKSNIISMSLLQRDEKYTDETIAILHDFKRDCKMTGTAQVCTCTSI